MISLKSKNSELLNPNLENLKESDTLSINEQSKKLIEEGRQIFRFGLGQSPFPVPVSVVNALRENAFQKDYLTVKGLKELRNSVASFHLKTDGIKIDPENILIGPGSKELLFLLQLVLNTESIFVCPGWVSYIPQAKILGKDISVIRSSFENRWQLTPELFENFIKNRKNKNKAGLMILNYPGNPDGVSFNNESLIKIAQLAKKNNIIILSDEIYGQLHHKGKHISIARYYPDATIISSGLSKWCGAGGWRLGTFAFPDKLSWLAEKMAAVASETYTSVSAPIQYAAIQAFNLGTDIEEYLIHSRRILSALGYQCSQLLKQAGVKVHNPEGGFYLLLDFTDFTEKLKFSNINTSKQLCTNLLEKKGVAILQGSSFGLTEKELVARLSYVDFDGKSALEASKKINLKYPLPENFINKYCPKVIEGVKQIVNWLNSL